MPASIATPLPALRPERRPTRIDASRLTTLRQIASAAARALKTPYAAITLSDAGQQIRLATEGELPGAETLRDDITSLALASPDMLLIPDALADKRLADTSLVTAAPHLRGVAAQALLSAGGIPMGALWIADTVLRPFDQRARDTLLAFTALTQHELRRILSEHAQRELLTQKLLAPAIHQMRGALTNIHGFSGWMLETDTASEQRQECLEIIQTQAIYLDDLVTELLELSQTELHRDQYFSWAMQDLKVVVEQALATCRTRTNALIALDASDSLPPVRLRQAVCG